MMANEIRFPGILCLLLFWVVICATASAQLKSEAADRNGRPLIIAHRGGALESTENTIEAFERAQKIGADGIEADIRLTRDGVIVVYHDDRFGRVEGLASAQRTRLISEMTYAEITAQPLVPVGEDTGGRRVPTLADLLSSVKSGLLNIEIKRDLRFDELVRKTIDALRAFPDLDRIVLEPPDLDTAKKLRAALGPRLKLHINPGSPDSSSFKDAFKRALKFKPHSISVSHKKITQNIVDLAHDSGVEVWVWTIDSVEVAEAMQQLDVDAIKTDRPEMLLGLLKRQSRN